MAIYSAQRSGNPVFGAQTYDPASVTLVIADALHAHTADVLGLSSEGETSLVIAAAIHAHTADNIALHPDSALTDSEKIDLILDILSNRQELTTGLYTLYADDGTAVLYTAAAWEDQAATIPYRGRGLARLDAMQ